jgi:hypothetical protein
MNETLNWKQEMAKGEKVLGIDLGTALWWP